MRYSFLVILDMNHTSSGVSVVTKKLAKNWPADLVAVGIIDPKKLTTHHTVPVGAFSFKIQEDERKLILARKKSNKNLQLLSQDCSLDGLACEISLLEGDLEAIVQTLSQNHDLLLIDQRANFLFDEDKDSINSIRKIIKNSARAVYICPEKYYGGNEVFVLYDGSLPAARALHEFLMLRIHHDFPIKIITINPDYKKGQEVAACAFQTCLRFGRTVKVDVLQSNKKPAFIVHEITRKAKPELVVMGAYGHTGLKEWIFGSVTEELLSTETSPLFLSV